GADGPAAEEQLNAIAIRVRALLERQARCFSEVCRPALAEHGVRILRWDELSATQHEALRLDFTDQLSPLVTPQALTRAPGHPFPVMPNLRLSLAALVRDSRAGPVHFAYLKVPDTLPRFVNLADGGLVPVEDVIRANLGMVYPGRVVEEAYAFRLTRGGDLELDEHHAASLLQVIEEETKRRPFGAAVRVEVAADMPRSVRELLLRELQYEDAASTSPLGSDDVYVFVELKARFDEERNIEWARKLEEAGIRVVYGLVELKTHAKTALVVRREAGGIRRYVHIGTGNYNAATAAMYTDLGLLSADPAPAADVNDLFNELSGSSQPPQTPFRRILVSPTYLLMRLSRLIDREGTHSRHGERGRTR